MIQGNNWANLFQGESVIELMNEMRFDAMVVGNHEFDFGLKAFEKRISEAKFPVLGANVQGLDGLKSYVIKGEVSGWLVDMCELLNK
jgi:2',3'-cyclic-nucleotide 2'-phosphodiesterase (5'-nucleotidase family)